MNDEMPKFKKLMWTFGNGKEQFDDYFDALNAAWSPDRTRLERLKYNGLRLEWEDEESE